MLPIQEVGKWKSTSRFSTSLVPVLESLQNWDHSNTAIDFQPNSFFTLRVSDGASPCSSFHQTWDSYLSGSLMCSD